MVSVGLGANIAKILLELSLKVLRLALYMGFDRYKRLVLAMSLVFLPPNGKFTYYRPAKMLFKTSDRHQKAGVRVYSSMRNYTNEYGI